MFRRFIHPTEERDSALQTVLLDETESLVHCGSIARNGQAKLGDLVIRPQAFYCLKQFENSFFTIYPTEVEDDSRSTPATAFSVATISANGEQGLSGCPVVDDGATVRNKAHVPVKNSWYIVP